MHSGALHAYAADEEAAVEAYSQHVHSGMLHAYAGADEEAASGPNPDAIVAPPPCITPVFIQKQDPGFPYLWRSRYFVIDHKRGALVYSEDAAGTKIKGAIPLELCHAVTPCRDDKLGFSVEIADRTFTCRFPKPDGDSARCVTVSTV